MVGFRAEYASGELTPDGEKIIETAIRMWCSAYIRAV
jgi:hypothetical protein